jgi:cytochrome c peroxidase
VAITGPYFHDGSAAALKDVVTKMAYMQLDKTLTNGEAEALVAFLNTLTDKARVPKKK